MTLQIFRKKGFTLIEMIMVISIIMIIYSFAAPNLSRFNTRKKLEFDAEKIASVLEVAKSEAATQHAKMKVEMDGTNNEFYYLDAAQTGKQFHLDKVFHLDPTVKFSVAPSPVIFRINGSVEGESEPVVITLKGAGAKNVDITINERTGRILVGDIY